MAGQSGLFLVMSTFMWNVTVRILAVSYTHLMSGMNKQMSNHFETVIKLRFGQVSGIVSVVSADNNNKEKLYEELVYRAQVRNFEHLALCSTEGNFQTLYGQSIQPLNPEPFVEALVRGEQRVALGSDPAGNLVVLFGVDATAYPCLLYTS